MENKAALRRLYYSHPLVVPKGHQLNKNIFQDRGFETSKKLGKTAPLLLRRSKTSLPRSLLNDWHQRINVNNGSNASLIFRHNSVIRDDLTLIKGFGAIKTREHSFSVGKSRKNGSRQLVSMEKPVSLDAVQKDGCSIGSNARKTAFSATKRPVSFDGNDSKKVNLCLRERISETDQNVLMFQKWGIRKCPRSAPIRYRNNWTNDRLNVEEWSQSVYCFNYKSTIEEMKQKNNDVYCKKEAKKASLSPNPSPTNSEGSQNTKLKNVQREGCREQMQTKSNEKEAEMKFELVLSAPKDEWVKELNQESVDEIDVNCLSPTMEYVLNKDWEPSPFRAYDHASEKKLHDFTTCRGSKNALALGDIFEAVEENEEVEENNLCPKL